MAETTAPTPGPRKRQRRIGKVVSAKMDKTIVVNVARRVQDPLYKRVVRRRKNFYAHDEHNQCREGDLVRIEETRPLSKLKRWRLVEVVERARA
ncbi:MAG TPA: 30S ribosomal protein S17 [Candidatus Acidoferrales bacterium]|uniref:Small ribosomal subunit protein uS17 n=1 Tax=uncultured Acidobacteria bacterium Rifle_16ft_4_minimus_23617 TaxID=1665082 RepID=A0A0H4T5G5_9BACT|nr:30S ribosomal protein S17, small subunit ribosomal protein S17 [uncultured Acidobacteria bacterium Rifle_16ft_4_minimus_23617]HKZ52347.1 30S ribosomal protein S17 [Candidatus Acidoferrales bacterium]